MCVCCERAHTRTRTHAHNTQPNTTTQQILSFHVVPDRALGAAELKDGDVLGTLLPGASLQVHAEP